MIASEFDFLAPKDLAEALKLLQTHGAGGKVLAGGMTLVPIMTLGLAHPEVVISLNHIDGLDQVEEHDSALRIGAMARHDGVRRHPVIKRHAPLLAAAAGAIGDVQVRNRGTLGGSLAHADPAADYLCATVTIGARFHVQKHGAARCIEATDFFQGVMTTALDADELLTAIEVPKQAPGTGIAHLGLRRVKGTFPIVVASAWVEPAFARARVGLGGVGQRPLVLDITDILAAGATDEALAAVGERAYEAAVDAMSDLNGSSAYRREMARVYARRAVRAAAANMLASGSGKQT